MSWFFRVWSALVEGLGEGWNLEEMRAWTEG